MKTVDSIVDRINNLRPEIISKEVYLILLNADVILPPDDTWDDIKDLPLIEFINAYDETAKGWQQRIDLAIIDYKKV